MMFPALFAVPNIQGGRVYDDDTSDIDRVSVFQARLVRGGAARGGGGGGWAGYAYGREDYENDDPDTDVYYITPFRIVRGPDHYGDGGDDSFVVEGRFGQQPHHHYPHRESDRVTLRTSDRGDRGDYHYDFGYDTPGIRRHDPSLLYRGNWRHTGYTVFSMYCAQPVPVLEFGGSGGSNIHWPTPPSSHYHRLVVVPAPARNIVPVWARRWNPDTWHREIAELVEERRAARRAAAAAPAPARAPAPPPAPAAAVAIPSFVADLIIADAVAKNIPCPITMEPLTKDSATVTSCYHVFDATALAAWVASGADGAPPVCPQCRARL